MLSVVSKLGLRLSRRRLPKCVYTVTKSSLASCNARYLSTLRHAKEVFTDNDAGFGSSSASGTEGTGSSSASKELKDSEEAEATPPLEEPIGETITTFDHSESRRSSAILELGNVYNASGAESMGQFSNPLHYDMKDKAATVSAKDLSRDDQLHRDRDEWAKERESLNEKIQELALRCGALQRRNEELVRTTQGESSSTTSASSPTVGYGAGSGEEGFHKDGVMAEDIIGDCL